MGKTSKNIAKRRRLEAETASHLGPAEAGDAEFLGGLLSASDVAIAARVLNTLTRNPELLKSKQELKALRGAVFDFQRISTELNTAGGSLTARISAALAGSRWTDALVLLSELRLRALTPKLGALQRWVRDCDAASRSDGSFGNAEVLRVLDAILRTTTEGTQEKHEPVSRKDEWAMRGPSGDDLFGEVQEGLLPSPEQKEAIASKFRLLLSTPGPERLPPNHHPALLYTSQLSTIPLAADSPAVTRHEVPNVPGAFLLADVLSRDECRSIVAAAEAVGFAPDKPVGESGSSILAHNLYWLADSELMATLWSRIVQSLPTDISGGKVTGLNARFRVYRYVPGAIYRPHVDGQWPKSGIDPVTGEYMYDCSPPSAPEWSRLTFLLYLNDAFPGGQTTFFLPSPTLPEQLEAYPVKPIAGCALVFPHGDASGSLLHEGSPVEGGGKYVIRTDVLYQSYRGAREGEGES